MVCEALRTACGSVNTVRYPHTWISCALRAAVIEVEHDLLRESAAMQSVAALYSHPAVDYAQAAERIRKNYFDVVGLIPYHKSAGESVVGERDAAIERYKRKLQAAMRTTGGEQ